ncbi:type-F conjugative transfer system protein TrbI [Providencia sp. wls1919]|nr:type-F conjugative transfer system protein TrbI [Providencia sp. wls1919]
MKKYYLPVLIIFLFILNIVFTYLLVQKNSTRIVSFDMKSTVDLFFDSMSKNTFSEEQISLISSKFNENLNKSIVEYQAKNNVVIMVTPAIVSGVPDITKEIQNDISKRMKSK